MTYRTFENGIRSSEEEKRGRQTFLEIKKIDSQMGFS
jgi:hypothetical protein